MIRGLIVLGLCGYVWGLPTINGTETAVECSNFNASCSECFSKEGCVYVVEEDTNMTCQKAQSIESDGEKFVTIIKNKGDCAKINAGQNYKDSTPLLNSDVKTEENESPVDDVTLIVPTQAGFDNDSSVTVPPVTKADNPSSSSEAGEDTTAPNTTPFATKPAEPPKETTIKPETTSKPAEKPSTPASTQPPVQTSSTTLRPEVVPEPKSSFDGWSFFGGILLTVGFFAVGFVGLKYYRIRSRQDGNYNRF